MATKARYVGKDGEYHNGIPARNLSEEDFEALDAEQRRLVKASPLYRMEDEGKQPAVKAEKEGG